METFSLKISDEELAALATLMERHGCTKAEAARRAIVTAGNGKTFAELEDKIDLVSASLAELLNLLIKQFMVVTEGQKQIRRYAAQAAINSAHLAAEAGVKDAATESYQNWKKGEDA